MQPKQPHLNYKRQKLARKYARIMRRLSLIDMAIAGVILLALIFGGISVKLGHLLAYPQPWASALYFIVLSVGLGIITMPLTYYQGFILPHRYRLSHQKLGSWLRDRAKALVLSFVLALAVVIFVYWLLETVPDTWWLWTAIVLLLLSLLLTGITPTLLLPIFYKLEPLRDKKLKRRLINLAKRAKAPISNVSTMNLSSKSTTANAMLAGIGKTRGIILTDTLLEKYSEDEIEVVLAHELGHHLHKDIPKLIGLQAADILLILYLSNLILKASLVPFGFNSMSDVAALPLLFLSLSVLTMIVTPFINSYSRHVEASADRTALELTANPQAFISAMTKLTNQNLSVADPGRWEELLFYDHPPYTKRVSLAQSFGIQHH
jgi:Zn-dependent protease with chaperone function